MEDSKAKLHQRRDDTTPFVIESEGWGRFMLFGQLDVMKQKTTSLFYNVPSNVKYVTLTFPIMFSKSFLWAWYAINGLDPGELPGTLVEALNVWRYLQFFRLRHDSPIRFDYIQKLNRFPSDDILPDPELFSIMESIFRVIPHAMIPPPVSGRTTPAMLSVEENIRRIRAVLDSGVTDHDWIPPPIENPPRSMDDIPPVFESNGIDKLYLSLLPPGEDVIPPSMKRILVRKSPLTIASSYIVLGLGTPNVRVWYGTPGESVHRIGLIDSQIGLGRIHEPEVAEEQWEVHLTTRYGTSVQLADYRGKVAAYDRNSEEETREYYPLTEVRLTSWVLSGGGTTYHIGKRRFPLQGNIITMSARSPTILSYYGDADPSSVGSGQRLILKDDEIDMNAFGYVWAYLNGQDDIEIPKDSEMNIWNYIRYFGISPSSSFVSLYFIQLAKTMDPPMLIRFLEGIPVGVRATISAFQPKAAGGVSDIQGTINQRQIPK